MFTSEEGLGTVSYHYMVNNMPKYFFHNGSIAILYKYMLYFITKSMLGVYS